MEPLRPKATYVAGPEGSLDIQMVGRKAFALHCPIMPILIDWGAVAPVERFAVEF